MCKAFVYKRIKKYPKKWSRFFYEMWFFTRGSDCTILTGSLWRFGFVVAYAGFLGGGLLLEVNTHGGSTVFRCLSM